MSNSDQIHKEMILQAPRSRVWRATTDSGEFGEWFGVTLQSAFVVEERVEGRMKNPKFEQVIRAFVED